MATEPKSKPRTKAKAKAQLDDEAAAKPIAKLKAKSPSKAATASRGDRPKGSMRRKAENTDVAPKTDTDLARTVTAEIVESQPTSLRTKTVSPRPSASSSSKTGLVDVKRARVSPGLEPADADLDSDFSEDEIAESPLARGPSDDDLEEMEDGAELDAHLPEIVASTLKNKNPLVKSKSGVPSKSPQPSDESSAVSSVDPVTTYLAEIRKYGLLTREQEHDLAIRYREHGDSKAAEMLVTSNLRFVVKVAAEYSRFGAKLIDLIQEGNVGLMHAVREYNPYKGVRLITYAVWWIRGYIQEYLMRQYSMVRIGTTQNQRKLFYRLQKERDLLDSMGKDANYALLSSRLGVSEEEVATMTKRMSGRDVSLSQPLDGGESAATLLDFEASHEPDAEVQIGNAEELNVLKDNIAAIRPRLSAKELYILDERILADDPLTLQEIGEHYGTTREAVRQLEARLIGKIRAAVTEDLDPEDHSEE